ncbi:MAG: hypothetical protein IKO94_01540 [Selenomonadaceae bacterium]|nr:hypothetical protein [Selenomonadaceae bacterium]
MGKASRKRFGDGFLLLWFVYSGGHLSNNLPWQESSVLAGNGICISLPLVCYIWYMTRMGWFHAGIYYENPRSQAVGAD